MIEKVLYSKLVIDIVKKKKKKSLKECCESCIRPENLITIEVDMYNWLQKAKHEEMVLKLNKNDFELNPIWLIF